MARGALEAVPAVLEGAWPVPRGHLACPPRLLLGIWRRSCGGHAGGGQGCDLASPSCGFSACQVKERGQGREMGQAVTVP